MPIVIVQRLQAGHCYNSKLLIEHTNLIDINLCLIAYKVLISPPKAGVTGSNPVGRATLQTAFRSQFPVYRAATSSPSKWSPCGQQLPTKICSRQRVTDTSAKAPPRFPPFSCEAIAA